MSRQPTLPGARARAVAIVSATAVSLSLGCSHEPAPRPPETFRWAAQAIAFEPPPPEWYREGENSGGLLGVRFVLRGGVGECITVAAFHELNDRDRRAAIARLVARRDSLAPHEFLHDLSLCRPPYEWYLSEAERAAFFDINAALTRAEEDYVSDHQGLVPDELEAALRAAESYTPTLADYLPRIRLRPEQMSEPDRWRLGYERDTTIAGHPAFAGDDTLIAPGQTLQYRQIFWVVSGCGFEAVYQGLPKNARVFERLVASIQFPESTNVASR